MNIKIRTFNRERKQAALMLITRILNAVSQLRNGWRNLSCLGRVLMLLRSRLVARQQCTINEVVDRAFNVAIHSGIKRLKVESIRKNIKREKISFERMQNANIYIEKFFYSFYVFFYTIVIYSFFIYSSKIFQLYTFRKIIFNGIMFSIYY